MLLGQINIEYKGQLLNSYEQIQLALDETKLANKEFIEQKEELSFGKTFYALFAIVTAILFKKFSEHDQMSNSALLMFAALLTVLTVSNYFHHQYETGSEVSNSHRLFNSAIASIDVTRTISITPAMRKLLFLTEEELSGIFKELLPVENTNLDNHTRRQLL
jgi:hypothetical protein